MLAVSGVVCCAGGIAGDMMQDLKVGHVLGGTPWRMEVGEIIGVVPAALRPGRPLLALDKTYKHRLEQRCRRPRPGLMALMAKGIVGGEMAWPLVIAGMFLAVGLILIKAPSPMLIAVGMYLPFLATAGIFVGGVIRWTSWTRGLAKRAKADDEEQAEGREHRRAGLQRAHRRRRPDRGAHRLHRAGLQPAGDSAAGLRGRALVSRFGAQRHAASVRLRGSA